MDTALPGPEREVLALLAESGLGYDGIAELLGVTRLDVATLAATARLRLARATPVPEACRAQLPHLASRIDDERIDQPAHPDGCASCAAALAAMRAADAAYRADRPPLMPDAVRHRLNGLSY
ncbi:hypothetical protein OJ997_21140 [Solirubrobacter phytolaccae]|uniref:Uncharacterized protein n=1 Tax=Solirubrobacter phytolaccae TaxID=1404360 RepID=A0A9X3NEX8_9ACTN|nr:hypothetical protein [Solirubrobacter phytolaccae]MDA0182831.1 hypothetical protein [Solirubrobacter phytolaccae]